MPPVLGLRQRTESIRMHTLTIRRLTSARHKFPTLVRRGIRRAIQLFGICPSHGLCENIVGWAVDRGWLVTRIHDPFVLDLSVPRGIEVHPRHAAHFDNSSRLGFPGQFLVCIPEARVKTSGGFVVLEEGAFLTEGHWRVSNVTRHPVYRNEWPMRRPTWRMGDWYCAMGHWGANYNHWMWDELPRLFSALPHLPDGTQFLVPEPLSAMQRESLLALGIAKERLVTQRFDCQSVVERLWFATPLGHSEWAATAPDTAAAMRDTLLRAFGVSGQQGGRRVYISRSRAKYRRLVNQDELLPDIRRLGFDVAYPEDLTFEEQVRTFATAGVVLGVHGAGLTNVLYCPSGALVLELHGPEVTRPHYWIMAESLGHEYRCLVGDPVPHNTRVCTEPDLSIGRRKLAEFLETAAVESGRRLSSPRSDGRVEVHRRDRGR